LAADSKTAVPDQYIVIFKAGLAKATRDAHVRRVRSFGGGVTISERNRFQIGNDFAGYSAKFSNVTLKAVRNLPEVAFVEADQTVHLAQDCVTQSDAPSWGLERIGERELNLDGDYTYESGSGSSVTAYIIDTGIYTEHNDFGGRAVWGENFSDTNDVDCNGHGTHVAGTVGGTAYGVAKQTSLIAGTVRNCGGSGTWAGVINGVAWTAQHHQDNDNSAVANMSLGGAYTASLNQAVAAAVATGVTFVVAAGNSNNDACLYSPASEPTAISVGATDVDSHTGVETDVRSSFSNFGTCTDVWAPGSLITAPWIGTPTSINTISGTSMASPHVCGIAALVADANPTFTPAEIQAEIETTATQSIIDLRCSSAACNASPNRLAYRSCPAPNPAS
jgi:subtilisin family serine protease